MGRILGLGIFAFIVWIAIFSPKSERNEMPEAAQAAAQTPRSLDSVSNAYAVCKVIDSTGLPSKPCEVSGWNSAVIATVDMTSTEARKVCHQIADTLHEKGVLFDERWTLQIRSPFSGENSIAFCKLPS